MTVIFAASEAESFVVSEVSDVAFDTSGTYHDTTQSRGAIRLRRLGLIQHPFDPDPTEVWIHWKAAFFDKVNSLNNSIWFKATDDTNFVDAIRFNPTNGTTTIQYWNGSSYASLGTFVWADQDPHDIDIHIKLHASDGELAVYVDGVRKGFLTGNTLYHASANLTRLQWASILHGFDFNDGYTFISEVVVTDSEPTLYWQVETLGITADGATSGWTNGDYTDIDEIGLNVDTDYIESTAANQVETFVAEDMNVVASGREIKAVAVGARSRIGTSGPQNLQLAARSGGTDYFSASFAQQIALRPYNNVWVQDPDTASAWIKAGVDAFEPGVKSIT